MEVRNATFNRHGTIDCEIEHPELGWLPYTADPDDCPSAYEAALALGPSAYVEPPVQPEALAAIARAQRNALLSACDWTQVPDAPVDQAAWATYRQALRDVPQQEGFPLTISWPVQP